MKIFRAIVLSGLVLLPWPAAAGEARKALDDYLADFKTLRAQFEQTVTDEQGKLRETSQGTVYLERPGKFHWEYTRPYEQSIIGDGQKVWIYDKDLEQVTIRPIDKVLNSAPALILGNQVHIDEKYNVTEMGEKDGVQWISLIPKDASHDYAGIKLGFEKSNLREMELADNFGQVTHLKFRDEQRNASIDDGVFSFTPPDGVDVNDLSRPRNAPRP
ncbi:MAG TPA: outer membrane lipoprotein chaperone LolA [Gammaproteobacteria bacterium]|nr:outer membrane lipoprotein chaperone LolA [Gammaproteobacteria bacterium]